MRVIICNNDGQEVSSIPVESFVATGEKVIANLYRGDEEIYSLNITE